MDPELLAIEEISAETRQTLDEADRDIAEIREQANQQVEEIRARADQAVAEIEDRAEVEVRERQMALLRLLRPMQDSALRAGRLDEALAIRERVRSLRANLLQALPDPGNLTYMDNPRPGSSQLFELTGSIDGIVWGTDIYTGDSTLAAVAVHAGVLADGETGMVRVTYVDTLNVTFTGSERNGVRSQDFGTWPTGYRIARG
jgi:hypothetical protein